MKLAMALVALAVAPLAAQDSTARPVSLQVTEAAIAKSVVDRAPQDTGSTFTADVAQLICWTRIEGASGDMTVHHVWFHSDQQVADVELRVAGSPWRKISWPARKWMRMAESVSVRKVCGGRPVKSGIAAKFRAMVAPD